MIITAILDVLYALFDFLFGWMSLPRLPANVDYALRDWLEYLTAGVQIMNCYMPLRFFAGLYLTVLGVDVGLLTYKMIMWIIRKIPISSD